MFFFPSAVENAPSGQLCGRHCVYGAQLHIWLKLRPAANVSVDCKHGGKEISPISALETRLPET